MSNFASRCVLIPAIIADVGLIALTKDDVLRECGFTSFDAIADLNEDMTLRQFQLLFGAILRKVCAPSSWPSSLRI